MSLINTERYIINPDNYDDVFGYLTLSLVSGATKPDFDFETGCYLFPENNITEEMTVRLQVPHSQKKDSVIYPHLHIRQTQNNTPIFKMRYRQVNIGGRCDVEPQEYIMNTFVYDYTSGSIHNILIGSGGISSLGKGISSMLFIELYRDDTLYSGDCAVMDFDIHFKRDGFGSEGETSKIGQNEVLEISKISNGRIIGQAQVNKVLTYELANFVGYPEPNLTQEQFNNDGTILQSNDSTYVPNSGDVSSSIYVIATAFNDSSVDVTAITNNTDEIINSDPFYIVISQSTGGTYDGTYVDQNGETSLYRYVGPKITLVTTNGRALYYNAEKNVCLCWTGSNQGLFNACDPSQSDMNPSTFYIVTAQGTGALPSGGSAGTTGIATISV